MPFGKYKHKELTDLPASYIVWLYENVDLQGKMLVEIAELYKEAKDEIENERDIIIENQFEIY